MNYETRHDINSDLLVMLGWLIGDYGDEKLLAIRDEMKRTDKPWERAELLRNALDYIRKNYEETEDGQVR